MLITVAGYRMPGFKDAKDLEGKRGRSMNDIASQLKEGECVTVCNPNEGYKQLRIENGQIIIQRRWAPEY